MVQRPAGKVWEEDGLATSTGSAQQFPNHLCKEVKFKVLVGNTVFVGDAAPAWPLKATEETDWIPCHNLNQFYHSTGAGGDTGTVYYMAIDY